MITTTARSLRQPFAAAVLAILLAACADHQPAAPDTRIASRSARSLFSTTEVDAASYGRLPDLTGCPEVRVPEGSKLSFHVYGIGVQIYRWNGAAWEFVAPAADLFADASGNGFVGKHFGGPTWQTVSGSRVVGSVIDRCTPNASAIAWLKLSATAGGSGVFEQTTLIQRVNTVGGLAPATPGGAVGDEVSVPYTADYFFYRAP